MNKSDFVKRVAEKAELSTSAAARVVEAIFDAAEGAISEAVHAAGSLSIPGFGKFTRKTRPARQGRNPRTGAEIEIPERTSVGFSAGKNLKSRTPSGRRRSTAAAGGSASGASGGARKSAAASGGARKSATGGTSSGARKSAAADTGSGARKSAGGASSGARKSAGGSSAAASPAAKKSAGSSSSGARKSSPAKKSTRSGK